MTGSESHTQKAVLYDAVGDASVLYLGDVPVPSPAAERVLLSVRAVGLNPYDAKARSGFFPRDTPFPRGIGGDVSGVVAAIGEGAAFADGTPIQVGDAVFGWGVNTLRESVAVRGGNLAKIVDGLSFAQAASLATPTFAAHALVTALALPESGTIAVSGASGAVGTLVCQWALARGLRVIGIVGEASVARVAELGVVPVVYGEGLSDRLSAALDGSALSAVYDSVGASILAAMTASGAHAMVTIAGDEVAEQFGAISTTTSSRDVTVLASVAADIASGAIRYDIAAEFALADVRDAFTLLETGHPEGKVVVAL